MKYREFQNNEFHDLLTSSDNNRGTNRRMKRVGHTEKKLIIHIYMYIYIQNVPGGMDKTSGECSLC